MRSTILTSIITVSLLAASATATIINIPDEYPTIQEGINASSNGDTVLVQPGTYVENISIYSRSLVLGSLFLTTRDDSYISSTVIDGDSSGSVVRFLGDVDTTTIITGFTLQNGNAYFGGGIYCHDSSPKISYNIIRDNLAFGFEVPIVGGGIFCSSSNPRILNNMITGNVVIGSYGSSGGGISCEESSPNIVNNTISGNSADFGGGIYCSLVSNPIITNTIMWDDSALYNAEIDFDDSSSPTFRYCDIEGGWGGEGNIDTDPLFRDAENGDYHLKADSCGDIYNSPCIDVGDPAIFDGVHGCDWGLGELRSDMGAYGGGDSATVAIDDLMDRLPSQFALLQNYPNPFNAATVIRYSLPEPADVRIEIFDILGRAVEILIDGNQQAGYHQIIWNADEHPSGVYFARLEAGAKTESLKLVLLR